MRDWARKAQSHILEAEAWLGISIQENTLGNVAHSASALDAVIEQLRPTGAAFAIARASLTLAERNRPAEALRLLNEANTTYALRNTKIGMWWTLLARSKSHLALNRLPEALSDAQNSQSLAQEIGLKTLQAQSAQQLSAIQAALGNYERAYQYATEAAGIKAWLANERTDSYMTELAERDERESQQREIDELNRRSEQQTAKEHWLWTVFAASLALLTITAIFLLRQSRANHQLATLNTQLAQSRNRLQATHDALPDLLFELDLEGRYYDCHSPRSELLAAPVSDLIGKTVAEVLPPEVVEVCMAALHEANEYGNSTGRQYSLTQPDGKYWFEMSIARKTVPIGEAPRFIGLARNISERKQFEARERIRLRTFELLAQSGEQQEILDLIASYVEEGRPDLRSSIMLVDDSGQHLHTVCAPRLPASYLEAIDGIPVGDGIGACGTAAWRRETVCIDDIASHPYWSAAKDLALDAGLQACWSEPIVGATGNMLGTFCIYRTQTGSPSAADLELARQASHLAAVAIERTRLAAALAASEQEFRTLAENSPDNIARYDTYCRVVYMNRRLAKTLGTNIQHVLGTTPQENDNRVLADYQAQITAVIETGLANEIEMTLPDTGEGQRHHLISLVAERDEPGNIIGVLAIGRDITERKRIEAALAASEREFRTLAENMPDFVARYDPLGRKTYLNNALIEMIGDALASQLATTPFESLPGDTPGLAEYEEKLRRTLSDGQPESMDGVVSRGPRRGEIHNLRFIAEHAHDGSIVGALVFSRDISELKKKEHQIEESRDLLRELAARRDTAREEERKRIAREVHDELGQMLSVQRLEIATMKFQFGDRDNKLGERCQRLLEITDKTIQVVRNVATALRPAALDMGIAPALAWLTGGFRQRTGIACQLLCAEEEIDLDEEQSIAVFRIVQESLTNITRYAEAQQVYIALESSGKQHYRLSIRDDGKGFDSAAMRSRSFGLIGIQERALMLGGEAHIFSTPGQGTAIEVRIPCHQTERGFAS
jgi:PAS domain S-box-containing protein